MRGIIRQHQFQKVELVKFVRPEQSYDELEKLTADAEDILTRLGPAVPDDGAVRRRHGLLFRQDVRHRSLAARTERVQGNLIVLEFRGVPGAARPPFRFQDGRKPEYVHTLNGSGLAVGRTWVAVVENYQQKDGSDHHSGSVAALYER